jgi:phosphoribosylamine-glycine ligase
VTVFHAGTKLIDGKLVTSGGRVLAVTAVGDSLESSIREAVSSAGKVHFFGAQYRKDIGHRCDIYFLYISYF